MTLSPRLWLYRLATSYRGKKIVRSLAPLVTIPGLDKKEKSHRHPFIVVLTADTEGGYVASDETRVWQKQAKDAFVGYYAGMRNLRALFEKHDVQATFFLNTHCFSSQGEEKERILGEIQALRRSGHEIGAHPHPDSDSVLSHHLKKPFPVTSSFFYSKETLIQILRASKEILSSNLSISEQDIVSLRWGNWALNKDAVAAAKETGFLYDSSAVPGLIGHQKDGRAYRWERVAQHTPWQLSSSDHQNVQGSSGVMEFPIATFRFLRRTLRADPIYSFLVVEAMREYYRYESREHKPFIFVVMTHSCEAAHKDGRPTRMLADLDEFIRKAKEYPDVQFMTLAQAAKVYAGDAAPVTQPKEISPNAPKAEDDAFKKLEKLTSSSQGRNNRRVSAAKSQAHQEGLAPQKKRKAAKKSLKRKASA